MKRLPVIIACLTITVQALGRSSIFDKFYFSDPITRKIDASVGQYKRNFGRLNRVYGSVSFVYCLFGSIPVRLRSPQWGRTEENLRLLRNLNSETVGDEDGLDLDMLIDQETAPRIFYCIITSKSKL